jgi:hypothetical protein
LFDGDFDGDTVHFHALTTPAGRASVRDIKIDNLLPEARPKRELAYIHDLPSNAVDADAIVRKEMVRFVEGDKLGRSIDFHDLLNDGKGTGYFDGSKVHRGDLRRVTLGLSKDDAWADFCAAALDFREIKQGVAQAGGISNCMIELMMIVFYRLKNEGKFREAQEKMRKMQVLKHILCQGMLAKKHGNRESTSSRSTLEVIAMALYRFRDCPLNTREEYHNFLTGEAELPEDAVREFLDLLFSFGEPPESVYKILAEHNPAYVLTRNPASMTMLRQFVNGDPKGTLHDVFIRARLAPGILGS